MNNFILLQSARSIALLRRRSEFCTALHIVHPAASNWSMRAFFRQLGLFHYEDDIRVPDRTQMVGDHDCMSFSFIRRSNALMTACSEEESNARRGRFVEN